MQFEIVQTFFEGNLNHELTEFRQNETINYLELKLFRISK